MGFFRRFKLTDHTAAECREEMDQLVYEITGCDNLKRIETMMESWACFRELLARHEKQNQSPLDKSNKS